VIHPQDFGTSHGGTNQDHFASEQNQVYQNDTGQFPMQPLMDFMAQDMDLMSFGLLDESWWRGVAEPFST